MNICLTSNYSPWSNIFIGGGQIVVHNLANELSRMGHKVYVIYTASGKVQAKDNEVIWAKHLYGRMFNIFSVYLSLKNHLL